MKIIYKNKDGINIEVNSIGNWFNSYAPKGAENHWVDGRSAKELAKYILDSKGVIPREITDILGSITAVQSKEINAIGEYVSSASTKLYGRGTGRNHDLLLFNDDIVCSIEAKADEAFGDKIMNGINKRKNKKSALANYTLRYGEFSRMLFGKCINDVLECYSQLLNTCAYTMLEAQKRNVKKASVIILVFNTSKTNPTNIVKNKNIFENFNNMFQRDSEENIVTVFTKETGISLDIKYVEIIV